MINKKLRAEVLDANLELVRRGLVIYTWGNVSEIDENREFIYIKPRGIEYDDMQVEDISVADMNGNLVEGKLLPSVDLDYHIEIYKAFEGVKAIAHTHSTFATAFCQALRPITAFGSTHGDHFYGEIPCLPYLSREEVEGSYEKAAGIQIVEYFKNNSIDPMKMRAVLCGGHAPFTWGTSAYEAAEYSVILEEVAKMANITMSMKKNDDPMPQYMLDKHYLRKFGKNAYFYQSK